jgi:hypothetical protein
MTPTEHAAIIILLNIVKRNQETLRDTLQNMNTLMEYNQVLINTINTYINDNERESQALNEQRDHEHG